LLPNLSDPLTSSVACGLSVFTQTMSELYASHLSTNSSDALTPW